MNFTTKRQRGELLKRETEMERHIGAIKRNGCTARRIPVLSAHSSRKAEITTGTIEEGRRGGGLGLKQKIAPTRFFFFFFFFFFFNSYFFIFSLVCVFVLWLLLSIKVGDRALVVLPRLFRPA
jgi:hypothetical protein